MNMKYILIILAAITFLLSPEKTTMAQSPTSSNSGSLPSNSVREKVREKIETTKNNPKAYIGTVTDKTQDSIQMKNLEGEIEFVSINPSEVVFIKIGKTTSNIKFTDLAIGDFSVVMGYLNNQSDTTTPTQGNGVLKAKRILIINPLEKIKRFCIYGEIIKIDKKTATIKDSGGENIDISFPKKWVGPEIKELNPGDKIFAVLIQNGNVFEVRTVSLAQKVSPSPTKKVQ